MDNIPAWQSESSTFKTLTQDKDPVCTHQCSEMEENISVAIYRLPDKDDVSNSNGVLKYLIGDMTTIRAK